MTLHLVPVAQRAALDCVARWHRHNLPPRGDLFRVGVATDDGLLVAVGIAGRPVSRVLQDGRTVEITRVASDGTHRNVNSMLYGALTRAAFALGYCRVITYTLAEEGGASLRAAGYRLVARRPAHRGWDRPSRPRDDTGRDLGPRTLWGDGDLLDLLDDLRDASLRFPGHAGLTFPPPADEPAVPPPAAVPGPGLLFAARCPHGRDALWRAWTSESGATGHVDVPG